MWEDFDDRTVPHCPKSPSKPILLWEPTTMLSPGSSSLFSLGSTFLFLDTFLFPLTPQDVPKCSCTVSVPTTLLPPHNAEMETKRAWTPEGARERVPEPQFPLLRKEDPHWGWCAKKYHMAHS